VWNYITQGHQVSLQCFTLSSLYWQPLAQGNYGLFKAWVMQNLNMHILALWSTWWLHPLCCSLDAHSFHTEDTFPLVYSQVVTEPGRFAKPDAFQRHIHGTSLMCDFDWKISNWLDQTFLEIALQHETLSPLLHSYEASVHYPLKYLSSAFSFIIHKHSP
jgi:hypothetical protein